jgi:hypothetical protein
VEKEFSMKKNIVWGMLGIFLVFSGCASLGGLKPLGTLTITDIPAEYEGAVITIPFAAGSGTVSNGSVSIDAQSIVDETGAANLAFNVAKEGSPSVGIFFKSVLFENRTAAVKWDDGVKTGLLTITGIPADYNRDDEKHAGSVVILAGKNLRRGGALAMLGGYTGSEASNQGWVVDGTLSIPLWVPVDGLPTPFIQNTALRVLLSVAVGRAVDGVAKVAETDGFIFESVQFTDGNASLSFSEGVKQQ